MSVGLHDPELSRAGRKVRPSPQSRKGLFRVQMSIHGPIWPLIITQHCAIVADRLRASQHASEEAQDRLDAAVVACDF